jgi:hypothetical protein
MIKRKTKSFRIRYATNPASFGMNDLLIILLIIAIGAVIFFHKAIIKI